MVSFRSANSRDLPDVLELLQITKLPTAGVEEHLSNFVLASEDTRVVGCAGLEVHGNAGLLRSVAILPELRSKGIGHRLTKEVINASKEKGLSSLSLLTTTAENYFPRFGFSQVGRNQLPKELAASEELKGACPDTAVAMILPIN